MLEADPGGLTEIPDRVSDNMEEEVNTGFGTPLGDASLHPAPSGSKGHEYANGKGHDFGNGKGHDSANGKGSDNTKKDVVVEVDVSISKTSIMSNILSTDIHGLSFEHHGEASCIVKKF